MAACIKASTAISTLAWASQAMNQANSPVGSVALVGLLSNFVVQIARGKKGN
jgi:hypothetical protein